MITMITKEFFWHNMKKEVAEYLACCIECQKVKAERQHLAGLFQLLPISQCKWEIISMDFITGLPKNFRLHDSIMVIVDKLSKETHFIPVKYNYKVLTLQIIL